MNPSCFIRSLHYLLLGKAFLRQCCLRFLLCLCFFTTPACAGDDIVLFFGGDTFHGESYQAEYAKQYAAGDKSKGRGDAIAKRGFDGFFTELKPLIRGCDLVALNLETALTNLREPANPDKPSFIWSDPVKTSASLKRIGVDVVTLGNNHSYDFGPEGLSETVEALKENGISYCGAGSNSEEAERPFVFRSRSDPALSVAIISAFEYRDWYEPFNFYATHNKSGVNRLDTQRLREQITSLKQDKDAPYVIVTPHWGKNYAWRSDQLRTWAEEIIDAGADMILGHGSHCLQEIEKIKGRWVVYSIGNFVFNSAGHYKKRKAPPYSLPVRLRLSRADKEGYAASLRAYPIQTDNRAIDYLPRPVTGKEMQHVRRLLLERDHTGALRRGARWGVDERGHYLSLGESTAAHGK